MKAARRAVLGVGLSLLAMLVSPLPSFALSTTPTKTLIESPLLITMYQHDSAGLGFVQLYNDGDEALQLSDWKLTNENGVILGMHNTPGGWVAPKTHVVASITDKVTSASVTIAPLAFTAEAKLLVIPPEESNYKQVEYDLKPAGGTVWRRSTTTTGYSSSTTSFSAFSSAEIFDDGLYSVPENPNIKIVEIYPYASDCSPHDESVLCGDYVKLYNPTTSAITLDDYTLRTDSGSAKRTSTNTVTLDGIIIGPGAYHTVWLTDGDERLSLTNSGGYVWFEDKYGLEDYELTTVKYESAGSSEQGYSWMKDDNESWTWTMTPQPTGVNVLSVLQETEQIAECSVGKYRNPETNRCRSIEEAVNALAVCAEGQYRSPETNRCRLTTSTTGVTLTPCKEGQERNPATNRCRSIASALAELLPCDEGYERNPATNRCRKSVVATGQPATTVAAAPVSGSSLNWVLGLATVGALGYGIYEWRSEISRGIGSMVAKLGKK